MDGLFFPNVTAEAPNCDNLLLSDAKVSTLLPSYPNLGLSFALDALDEKFEEILLLELYIAF